MYAYTMHTDDIELGGGGGGKGGEERRPPPSKLNPALIYFDTSGGSLFSSHPSKLDPAEVPRGFLVESAGREGSKSTDRGGEISKDPKCLLSK